MILKTLIFAFLLYFVLKAVLNIVAAVRAEAEPRQIDPLRRPFDAPGEARRPPEREPVSGRTYRRPYEDVEDAKWEDLP